MREAAFGQGLGEQQGCSPSYWGYYFTFFSSCAQGLGSDCGVGISSIEAVCLDPRLLLFPEGSRGFVPSPCLPKALRKSKHPLGWDQAPSAKLLIIALVVFVDSCQILFHCSPPTGGLEERSAAVTLVMLPGLIHTRTALGGLWAACLCPECLM